MKFGFVTCVQLGLSCMEAIYEVNGKLDLVITLNDDQATEKSGRIYLDNFCNQNNIPLIKSSHINNEECLEAISRHEIDWLFIIGWSQIASSSLLASPIKGVLGMHPTLLPQGRGRASIPWAILKNLDKTGVTLFKLDEGVDTGQLLDQFEVPLTNKTTATELYSLVNDAHVLLMKNNFQKLNSDKIELHEQDELNATVWPGRKPSDGEIDLNGSVHEAERLVRALTKPYPGAFIITGYNKYVIWVASVSKSGVPSSVVGQSFKDGFLVFDDYEVIN